MVLNTPSDKGLESVTYSAKKKQHSFTQLVYCTVNGKICHVSSSFPGSCNDSFIAQTVTNNFLFHKLKDNEWILGDKGFQGLQKIGIVSAIPDNDVLLLKVWNWMVKKYRIVVENVIAELKRWKILHNDWQSGGKLTSIYQGLKYHTMIVKIVAGLVNMYSPPRRNEEFFESVRVEI
jgi:hypothetical protein